MLFIMCFMAGTIVFGFALFLPSIVSQLGFSPNTTQLLSVGPSAVAFFSEQLFKVRSLPLFSQGLFATRLSSDYIFCFLVRPL